MVVPCRSAIELYLEFLPVMTALKVGWTGSARPVQQIISGRDTPVQWCSDIATDELVLLGAFRDTGDERVRQGTDKRELG